jgi:hypothetical protein
VKNISGSPLKGKLLTLSANTRPGWKALPGANTLAYYKNLKLTAVKSFITLAPGVNVYKTFFLMTHAHTLDK